MNQSSTPVRDGKRKRAPPESYDSSISENDQSEIFLRHKKQRLSGIGLPGLLHPPSLYQEWRPPQPPVSEEIALDKLLEACPENTEEEFIYVTLSNFYIYRPMGSGWHPGTMAPLSDLLTRPGDSTYMFDGLISHGRASYYVQNVAFKIVSVEGYDEETASVQNAIYLQSDSCERTPIWYKLSTPAEQYRRFHENYLWLADFTKHFICYLSTRKGVSLRNFKQDFHDWMETIYRKVGIFRLWRDQFPHNDFRTVVVNNYDYLWKESTSVGVDEHSHNRRQPIWKEIDPKQLEAVPKQPLKEVKTVVTPYVYDLFRSMYFCDQLESREPSVAMTWNFDNFGHRSRITKTDDAKVEIGDVICLPRDESGHWKDKETTWYAYIHDMERDERRNDFVLHIFWLYRPSETTCGSMRYPFGNELFFSDHCNCSCDKSDRIYASEVKDKISVGLFANSTSTPPGMSYFIRQTYITEDDKNWFVTLNPSHLQCDTHRKKKSRQTLQYCIGDTLLIRSSSQALLEPVELVAIEPDRVRVRKLLRRRCDLGEKSKQSNELVYTPIVFTIPYSGIVRKCNVRFYCEGEEVPTPYNYGGVADCWIITGQLLAGESREVFPIYDSSTLSLRQGFDPFKQQSTFSVLDLFCGGGSFGRGIEDGGIAKVRWACDLDAFAIHTKRANLTNVDDTRLFFGSAVDYFAQAADGRVSELIAKIGEVYMIIAGSPCQGFSLAQQATASARSRKNASMVALVVAFIDLYRPKYALLENVFGMTRKFGLNKDEDVFAQIVCALVGLGYQVQYHIVDAFSHGGPQNRSRIFVSVAAPGLTPLQTPPITHESPADVVSRGIGRSLAGVKFGSREFLPAPFPYNSASNSTKDLPLIGDSQVGICIPFPDHRPPWLLGYKRRVVIPWIPLYPNGSSFVQALQADLLPRAILEMYHDRINSMPLSQLKIFRRLRPDQLFDTFTTTCSVDNARDGRWIHWHEHRSMTVQEAKRAQSFPDHEPLIGMPSQQWKLVGNAVSRYVATAWGVTLRDAVLANSKLVTLYHEVIKTVERTVALKNVSTHWAPESSRCSVVVNITKPVVRKQSLSEAWTPEHSSGLKPAEFGTITFSRQALNRIIGSPSQQSNPLHASRRPQHTDFSLPPHDVDGRSNPPMSIVTTRTGHDRITQRPLNGIHVSPFVSEIAPHVSPTNGTLRSAGTRAHESLFNGKIHRILTTNGVPSREADDSSSLTHKTQKSNRSYRVNGFSQSYTWLDASSSDSDTNASECSPRIIHVGASSSTSNVLLRQPALRDYISDTATSPATSDIQKPVIPIQWPKSKSTSVELLGKIKARGALTYAASVERRIDEQQKRMDGQV